MLRTVAEAGAQADRAADKGEFAKYGIDIVDSSGFAKDVSVTALRFAIVARDKRRARTMPVRTPLIRVTPATTSSSATTL